MGYAMVIGCGQALPGQTCSPNDVAMSANMRDALPTVDLFGNQVNLGVIGLAALFPLLMLMS